MHHLFISYSREDAAWVFPLRARLQARDLTTWIDQHDIPVTLPWLEEVQRAVAGASLFVLCESPASRASASCNAEVAFAADAAKRCCSVDVGGDLIAAEASIVEALEQLDAAYARRTELAVLARDWDDAGRPRGALAGRRLRKRLRATAHVAPPFAARERAFLRASRTRTRRRGAVSALVVVVAAAALLSIQLASVAQQRIDRANSEQAAFYSRARADLAAAADPFTGAGLAALRGANESAVAANVVSAALRFPVPDDAFRVPATARRFTSQPIGATITVADGRGRGWSRPAAGGEVRQVAAVAPTTPRTAGSGAQHVSFRAEPASGTVTVRRDGRLWRRMTFQAIPSVARLSPDGRELAVADASRVEIADLQLGVVRTLLPGNGASFKDLAWTPDGRRLWGLSGRQAMSWPARDGRVLVDEPGTRFQAVMPSDREGIVWVVDAGGRLRQLGLSNGRVLRTLRVHDKVVAAADDAAGTVAALSGERGIWIVPLTGTAPRLVRAAACAPGRASFRDASTFYVPCLENALLTVSVPDARITARRSYLGGVSAVKVTPRSKTLLRSDATGRVFAQSPDGDWRLLWTSNCGGKTLRLAVADDERAIVPVGGGTGVIGCFRRGVRIGGAPADPSSWKFDAVSDATQRSRLAETAAFSRSGRIFAYGYSDGTIVLHPTENLVPTETITTVDGTIRDLYVDARDDLVAVTDEGIVQRIQLCDACLSNRAMAHDAAARNARSLRLGTARRVAPRADEAEDGSAGP